MDLVPRQEYLDVLQKNEHHLTALLEIVKGSKSKLEGNCFYLHLTHERAPQLLSKQINIFSAGRASKRVLEIGFNAGHSALLLLLSRPDSKIDCFDICCHDYTRKCFEYLDKEFPNRLTLTAGPSGDTVPWSTKREYDLYHIDGDHSPESARIDFENCYENAREGSLIIYDDTWLEHLFNQWKGYIREGKILPEVALKTPMYSHDFGRVIKPARQLI